MAGSHLKLAWDRLFPQSPPEGTTLLTPQLPLSSPHNNERINFCFFKPLACDNVMAILGNEYGHLLGTDKRSLL
jgi:hypothetical protein